MEIVNGKVQFKYDLGSGPLILTSNKVVSDGIWHQVIVERSAAAACLSSSHHSCFLSKQIYRVYCKLHDTWPHHFMKIDSTDECLLKDISTVSQASR